jgi:hypothetical protein
MVVAERPRAPVRDEILNIRLTSDEKQALVAFAIDHDLRVAQAIRHILRERLVPAAVASGEGNARP